WQRRKTATMGLDDRSTDRKSHPHAVELGREQRFEDPIRGLRTQPGTGILDRNLYLACVGDLRGYSQDPGSIRYGTHRLDAVSDQVEQHLLQLNPIAIDRHVDVEEIDMKYNGATLHFAAKEHQHLPDGVIDVDIGQFQAGLSRKRSQTFDDIRGAPTVARQTCDRVARFRDVGGIAVEPAQANLDISYYGSQRLIDLVNDGPGELAHRG